MSWTVIAVALAVTLLLVVLIYPFRIRVQYDKRRADSSPLQAAIRVFKWWPLPLSIGPLGSKQHPRHSQQDGEGRSKSGESHGRSADTSDPSAEHTGEDTQGPKTHAREEGSLLRMAVVFIRVLIFETGERPRKRRASRPPSLRRGVAPHILRSIKTFDRLEWETRVGTGDAASTALAVGAFWSLKGALYTVLAAHVRFTALPAFNVEPDWNDAHFEMRIDCIFRLRIGEIILAWLGDTLKAWHKGVQRFGLGKGTSY